MWRSARGQGARSSPARARASGARAPSGSPRRGARVTCVDIDRDAVEAVAREIGDAAFAVTADVSDPAQVKAYTDGTVERWAAWTSRSTTRAVNIPGSSTRCRTRSLTGPRRHVRAHLRLPLRDPAHASAGGGSLINTTRSNRPGRGAVPRDLPRLDGCDRDAVQGHRARLREAEHPVNALAPGWVDTPINYRARRDAGGPQGGLRTIDSFSPSVDGGEPSGAGRTSPCSSPSDESSS